MEDIIIRLLKQYDQEDLEALKELEKLLRDMAVIREHLRKRFPEEVKKTEEEA